MPPRDSRGLIAAVVLAAGRASRMGRPKVLLPVGRRPLLAWAVERLVEGGVDDVVVVTGPTTPDPVAALAGLPVRLAHNPAAAQGMSTSIRVGLLALSPAADAAFVALGDQPSLQVAVVRALIARYRAGGCAVVVPSYRGERSHPVLFDRSVFTELWALEGDVGGRAVVERDPSRVAVVELDLDAPRDVDTPEEYRRLASEWDQAGPG